MKKKIVIVAGEPNSINSEIIFKSWRKISKNLKKRIYIISNYNLLSDQLKKLKCKIKLVKVSSIYNKPKKNYLKVLDVSINYKNPFMISKKETEKYVKRSLSIAHNLAIHREIQGIINCPVNKEIFKKAKIGVTEYLAKKCNVKDGSEAMLIHNKKLSVSPITIHIDVKQISNNLNQKIIEKKIQTINFYYRKIMKKKPKIGVLGLNPHNAELRKNSEEKRIIFPSILKLKKKGINIKGPLVSDTIFMNDYKNFDVIVGMYHDQVLSPFKTLFKFDAINITLGLDYIRVSPDHGTARELIGKNKANPLSLLKCIDFLAKN